MRVAVALRFTCPTMGESATTRSGADAAKGSWGSVDSTLMTIGLVLDVALQRGLHVDVETSTGRLYSGVRVSAVDRFCVVLLDGSRAHVVSREHLVSVSLGADQVLELTDDSVVGMRSAG